MFAKKSTFKIDEKPKEEEKPKEVELDLDENLCVVCFDKKPDSVFMECGHGGIFISQVFYFLIGTCYECSLDIW